MQIEARLREILDLARRLGASYADVRHQSYEEQTVATKNGRVQAVVLADNVGFGVRVMVDGAWGFSSGPEIDTMWEKVTREAVAIAKASGRAKRDRPIGWPALPALTAEYRTPIKIDPFSIPVEKKLELLLKCDRAMRDVRGVRIAKGSLSCQRIIKHFGNTEGRFLTQHLIETGGGIECTAVGKTEMQKRSYPNSFGRQQGTCGWELIEDMHLEQNAARIAEEVVALLSADECPTGENTIILDPTQLALQVHESCGHAVELDRVFGMEASYAGTSFLDTAKLNNFTYGSKHVNLFQDGTIVSGLGTYGFDDDGVPTCRTELVKEGRFVGYLMSRETAADLELPSNGANRATSWDRIPIVRMTNVCLAPGDWTFEDLIADTKTGIYMVTNRSWSIDDKRLNFQFGTEIAWEIKNGKLGRMLKNPIYTGITPHFWANCDAVCNEKYWGLWGTPNCGKGQPSQIAHVGHGVAPARFRNVHVGVK